MKNLKSILLALFVIIISAFFFSKLQIKTAEKQILTGLKEKYPDENFYFIYGLDREWSIATNVRYRGIIYSDRLKNLNYPEGLEISLESSFVKDASVHNMVEAYKAIFWQIEIDGMAEKKAKEIFGEKVNLMNGGMTTPHMYKNITDHLGIDLPNEKKSGYFNTIVNVFIDDLETFNIEKYKEDTYELSKYIYEYMNYVTSLQIYIRDNSYFKNYNLVKYSIYKPFRNREDIKKILKKIKKKSELNENEKIVLVNSFKKGGLDFKIIRFRHMSLRFKDKIENPISKENIKISKIYNKISGGNE